MCHMNLSHFTCNVSHVTCHVSLILVLFCFLFIFFIYFFLTKWWSHLLEGLLSTGLTPSSSFGNTTDTSYLIVKVRNSTLTNPHFHLIWIALLPRLIHLYYHGIFVVRQADSLLLYYNKNGHIIRPAKTIKKPRRWNLHLLQLFGWSKNICCFTGA